MLLLLLLPGGRSSAQLLAPVAEPIAVLERTTVPAAGRHEVVLTVARFGRYAITITSEQGMSLQLVDRMAGPGSVHGIAGEEDGRIDTFLDYGQYLVIATGHELAEGEASLAVASFNEASPMPAPQLIELKSVAGELADLQQRSYWLQVKQRRWIAVEAAGRTLRDLRLWMDGSWLLDVTPQTEVLEPHEGKPLLACRLVTQLEPGLYLLTAYGGREQPWADDSGEYPYHLRMGIPKLGTAGRAYHEVGPLGIDRWLVPARANYYRLELPEQLPAELRVGNYSESSPYAPGGSLARIDKESRVPMADLGTSSSDRGWETVTVRAEAGQSYILQHFQSLWHYSFSGSGAYWLSTIHSGHPADSIDATSFVAHWDRNGDLQREPLRQQVIEVGPDASFATRCNLLETLSLFLRITETGSYTIESQGTEAEFLIEPFFVYRPSQYRAPPFRQAGYEWELDEGYYVLTVKPKQKGILDMAIKPTGLLDSLLGMVGLGSEVEKEPVTASSRYPTVPLSRHHRYEIFMNRQPEVKAGVILRSLPLSLDDPLPLTIRPGHEVEIPITANEPSRLQAVAEDGRLLPVLLDDGPWQQTTQVPEGRHAVKVRNDGEQTIVCSAGTVPLRLLHTAELPPLPEGTLDLLPEFPVVTARKASFFDLEREQRQTFLVSAADDALYRLETTGLLDTEGNLRSRVVTTLARSAGGGTGRNLFLHQYLCAGDYQITLNTRGRSTGHLGLELTRTDPLDGGELRLGLPARTSLDDGESVVYRFTILEGGRFRLRSFALGHVPRCRLENADGWPIVTPNVAATFTRHFDAGEYRLVLLPEAVAGRRLTLLEPIVDPPSFEGHGPHELPLASTVPHRWLEPEGDEERLPDVWLFSLTGPTEVSIRLTSEMHGRLVLRDLGGDRQVAYIPPLRGWQGRLETGSYALEAECVRKNNRVDYQVRVDPTALLPGMERTITAPATIPVAIGAPDLVEISSFGTGDVSAQLADSEGRMLARNDDRTNDWNFHLASRLQPGEYTLQVTPVAGSSATTTVAVQTRRLEIHEPLDLQHPLSTTIDLGNAVHTFPLRVPPAEMLLVAARSTETVGLALERQDREQSWTAVAIRVAPVAGIELPLADGNKPYRLRLWSVDQQGNPVSLTAAAVTPDHLDEQRLARGVTLRAVAGIEPRVVVAAVEVAPPGTFRRGGSQQDERWSAAAGTALQPLRDGILPIPGSRGWIALPVEGWSALVKAERIVLRPGAEAGLQLPLTNQPPALVDLDGGGSGPLLVLARSMVGQPVLRVLAEESGETLDLRAVAIGRNATASLSLQPDAAGILAWLAEPADEPLDVRLQAFSFPRIMAEEIGFGQHTGKLAADDRLRAFTLPAGTKRLRVVLTGGLVAAVTDGAQVLSLHWAGGETVSEQLLTGGSRLLLLHTGASSDRYTVELMPEADAERLVLTPDRPLQLRSPVTGTLRVDLPAGDERTLHVRGTASPAVFLADTGQVLRGDRISIGTAAGTLLLPHDPGLLLAWFDRSSDENPELGLWRGTDDLPPPVPVNPPQRLALEGEAVVLALDQPRPVLLRLANEGRALFRLTTPDATRAWIDDGGVHHAYLPAGACELAVRGLAGAHLAHHLVVVTTPITEVGEGLGPEVLLPAGGAHAFRFTVTEAGKVGVGVRADADTVDCALLTPGGATLGSGVIQLHELTPGDYLLLVRLPAEGAAVRARPAVVGIERPPTRPPEEVVKKYLDMERSSR